MNSNSDFESARVSEITASHGEGSPPQNAAASLSPHSPHGAWSKPAFDEYPLRSRGVDVEQAIASVLMLVQRWSRHGFVGLYLYDEGAKSLRLHMSDSEFGKKLTEFGMASLEGTLAGQVFRYQESVVFDHAELKKLPYASVQRGLVLGVRSLCMVPIISSNASAAKESLGVLKISSRDDQAFSAQDVESLQRSAEAAAVLLENVDSGLSPRGMEEHPNAAPSAAKMQGHSDGNRWFQNFALITDNALASPDKKVPPADPPASSELEPFVKRLFGASTPGLCVLNRELRYLAVNNILAEMNGIPASDHLGKTLREIVGSPAADLLEPALANIFVTGEPAVNFEFTALLPARTEPGWWVANCFPIFDGSGKVKELGSVVVEITQQKKLEESLRGVTRELQVEKKRLQTLLEISQELAINRDLQEVFPRISAIMRRVLHQEYASFDLYDEQNNLFVAQAVDFPLGKGLFSGASIVCASSPQGKAMTGRHPVIFSREDLSALLLDSSMTKVGENFLAEGLRSWCCVPLLRPTGPVGVLSLASTRENAFQIEDFALLNQVAAQLGIALENARTTREIEELKVRLEDERVYTTVDVPATLTFEEIVGNSVALKQVLDQVAIVATSDATVLILGETGTGKELVARAIHRLSPHRERNFIKVNCAAIPTGLLESELFGHEKGAFTGAISQKIGRIELADHGTLFLDEIGEISLELQPKLLRVLQDQEFERLGGIRTIKVHPRLIAATNRDLARDVLDHEFRSDLFYRLNVFPIRMPSLRERSEDIPLLVRHFVRKHGLRMDRHIETIPGEAMKALVSHGWPGNVRELENFIERSVILSEGTVLRIPLNELLVETTSERAADRTLENAEREHIIQTLRETHGVISGAHGAAHRLGLKRTTLQSMMQRLKISREDYIGPGEGGRRKEERPR